MGHLYPLRGHSRQGKPGDPGRVGWLRARAAVLLKEEPSGIRLQEGGGWEGGLAVTAIEAEYM